MKPIKCKRKIVSILLGVLLAMILILGSASYICFGTFYFPKVIAAMVLITRGETEYIEVKSDPGKVIIGAPHNALGTFENYLQEQGYVLLDHEQMGSLYVVSHDGKTEVVHFSVNSYYSKWQWK